MRHRTPIFIQAIRLQVERQIDQMVKFIKQEAEEKANEISVSAEEVRYFQRVPETVAKHE